MKRLFWIMLLTVAPRLLFSYEKSMLNLKIPSGLEVRQVQFQVLHRFYGKVDEKPFDTFFGMQNGANIGLCLRLSVGRHIEVGSSYIFEHKEYNFWGGYAVSFPKLYLRGQIDVKFFSFRPSLDERKSSVFFRLDLQTEPVLARLTPVVNLGYDGYYEKIGLGVGADIYLFENVSVSGEYYPVLDSENSGMKNSVAFGFKFQTYGHHFIFLVGNNYEIGTRQLMRGAFSNNLYFGFNIYRLLEL